MNDNKISDFYQCLDYEHKGFEEQDSFYKNKWGVEHVHRYAHNSDYGKQLQRRDVDAILLTNEGKTIYVSEKRHTKDDVKKFIIELYSIYENNDLGWSLKNNSDIIAQFSPNYVFEIVSKPLVAFSKYLLEILSDDIKTLYNSSYSSTRVMKTINDVNVNINLFKTKTYSKNFLKGYYTSFALSMNFNDLNKFGIKSKMFLRND